jgi:hypothetical protein
MDGKIDRLVSYQIGGQRINGHINTIDKNGTSKNEDIK